MIKRKLLAGATPYLVFIGGMAGTRKSSTALKLAAKLNFASVISTDQVRTQAQVYDNSLILQGKTTDRWRLFGKLNERNLIKGFIGQSKALRRLVIAGLRENISIGENTIIEGAHLIPSLYKNISSAKIFHFILAADNIGDHLKLLDKKFKRRHGRQKPWPKRKINLLWEIQNYLIRNARKNQRPVIRSTTPERNCQLIVKYLKENA